MSRFKPVHLPDDRRPNGRASQTFLRHYAGCPRSGFLYLLHKGEASTAEMQRGKAFHLVPQRAVELAIEQDEPVVPGEIVKDIVNEVLREVPVPFEEHDYIREMSWRWAAETAIDPRSVVACETLFVLDLGDYEVRCKIDYACLIEEGAACAVTDYKTAKGGAPAHDEVTRKRPDGSLSVKQFQLILYALCLAFGVPVRVEPCAACVGRGWSSCNDSTCKGKGDCDTTCPACEGRGFIETREPFPVAAHAHRFDLEYVYPGIENAEGLMVRRGGSLTRAELDEYRESLAGLLARLSRSEATGHWPAVVSDAACAECPAKSMCPIPRELRDFRGELNTAEEAAEAFSKAEVEKKINAALQKERRSFVQHNGPVRFGNEMVAEIGFSTSERISDKEGMFAAQERAVRYGEPFERHRFVKTVESHPLVVRALTADELAENEGSNGRADGRDGRDGDGSRFGDDPPF
jgi:hypothetical protein